jgi:hypothetical protein
MRKLKTKAVVLGLATLLAILALTVSPFAASLSIFTGEITRIEGNTVTLNSYKTFVPANERATVPDWAEKGVTVKVGYYIQNHLNYYHEIGRPGKELKVQKESWGRSSEGDT